MDFEEKDVVQSSEDSRAATGGRSAMPGGVGLLTDDDIYLFNEGTHFRLYEKLGAHLVASGDQDGACFAVWAPNAERLSVIGDFNGWDNTSHPLARQGRSGIWEGFVPGSQER